MGKVFIGVGSNLGQPYENCLKGIALIQSHPFCRIQSIAPFYRTEPLGFVTQPWFVNSVALVETSLSPLGLLKFCLEIENQLHRKRLSRWGPRTLDLDILSWDDSVIISSTLIIPHPRLHQRRFVLEPFFDIAPDYLHPVIGKTIKTLLSELNDQASVVRMIKEPVI